MLYVLVTCLLCVLGADARSKSIKSDSRVVNGTDALPGEIPYIVSLRYDGYDHICGGSIVDEYHVLTAAHCIKSNPTHFAIQHGITSITETKNIIKAAAVYLHEDFNRNAIWNDVAIIKLKEPIPFDKLSSPIQLPAQGESHPANEWGVLAGWGLPYSGGSIMMNLQRVDLLVYSDEECKRIHENSVDKISNLCGGVPEGGKGQCTGDSGGPLVANGKQWGIVSWSVKPCTIKGYPGVYARVSSYIDWINEKISL